MTTPIDVRGVEAVCRVLYDYAWTIDQRDWAAHRRLFADEFEVDVTTDVSAPNTKTTRVTVDQWLAAAQGLCHGLAATQHCMYNPYVELDGHRAVVRMYMQAEHFLDHGHPAYTIGGWYRDELILVDERWTITKLQLSLYWSRGDPQVLAIARRRVATS